MTDKKGRVAVAVVHGIGKQEEGFEEQFVARMQKSLPDEAVDEIIFKPVHWAPVLNERQAMLKDKILPRRWFPWQTGLHRFMIEFVSDAVAYPVQGRWVYQGVHEIFAQTLRDLRDATHNEAPLCVISHSLGTLVASNFFWDLQAKAKYPNRLSNNVSTATQELLGHSPLTNGQTMNLFYTMGSPLALWSLLHRGDDTPENPDFGTPIDVPAPNYIHAAKGYPQEWINLYDKDDVIAYPLANLNEQYAKRVTDRQIEVGFRGPSDFPSAHLYYWNDRDVINPICKRLTETWEIARKDGPSD